MLKKLLSFCLIVVLGSYSIGQTSFSNAITIDTIGSSPEVTRIGDLNNDGLNDIVVGTQSYFDPQNDYRVFIYYQDSSAWFQQSPIKFKYSPKKRIMALRIGDVNNDKLNDLIIGFGDSIGIFYQNSSGSLNSMIRYYSGKTVDGLGLGDFNDDGRTDIAVGHWGENFIRLFIRTATGYNTHTYPSPNSGRDDLEIGDVNNDGLDDVVFMTGQGQTGVHVFTQKKSGLLNAYSSYNLSGKFPRGVAIGDFNGDGRKDVAASLSGNRPHAEMAIWLQNASGTLPQTPQFIDAYDLPHSTEMADFNCDGTDELLVLNHAWGKLSLYDYDSINNSIPYHLIVSPYVQVTNPYALSLGDINDDGLIDIALPGEASGKLMVHLNESKPIPSKSDSTYSYVNSYNVFSKTYTKTTTQIVVDTDTLINEYIKVTTTTLEINQTYQSDSITTDSINIYFSPWCGGYYLDTLINSCTINNLQLLKSDTSVLSISSNTFNPISDIQLFPNPSSGNLTLKLPSPLDTANVQLIAHSSDGSLMRDEFIIELGVTRNLDISEFASGVYLVKLKIGSYNYFTRIVKE
ncbi:FG-GAP repeat protein [Owenweeksia hongkongensis DSM 17368]|uniref:FG-GAP repeat protein n=1 Tax=Owenweeksia hongkongensis (strain DSM 17368 / CIP 108786 / JCM 12287 / NRRL B-23963 / UST20020801) TaxID=926562 RepID=G8R8J9_OWEHD|nr:T9SS type A sorting domain-containing protein [Owenweeksia hongkongensis]AEV31381.1 FG-GAP repeat protein [Owenweeksia hongkongensis DSM 17368]